MKKIMVLLCSLSMFFSVAANAETVAKIDYLRMGSSNIIKEIVIPDKVGDCIIDFTVSPLELGPSNDGKGVALKDSNGKKFFFAIDDGHSFSAYDTYSMSFLWFDDNTDIITGEKYRFSLTVNGQTIKIYKYQNNNIELLTECLWSGVFPLSVSLVSQRTGAEFFDMKVSTD